MITRMKLNISGKLNHRGWQSRKRKELYDSSILSTARSETPCGNLPAPSGKAKYSWNTDSELVPWGKGEKNPEQGSKIEPETIRLQAVGVLYRMTACLLHNEPTSYSSLARLSLLTNEAVAKASLNRARVSGGRRETLWSTHDQDEVSVTWHGGPNQFTLKSIWMSCG